MNTLAIDCSSTILSISLEIDNRLFESSIRDGFKNSENLMPLIDSLFKTADFNASNLDLVSVALGPGSFTGLRIAMSTAKGIAFGSGAALVTVPTMDAYSRGFDYFEGVVIPVIDARKKRFYCALFEKGKRIEKDLDISAEDLFEMTKKYKKILITGPDSHLFKNIAENNNRIYIDDNFTSNASLSILKLGIDKYKVNGPDPDGIGPLYIRKSEAEISLYGE